VPEQRYLYLPPADVDPAVRALIRHKADKLVGNYGFTRSDREDLKQELALQAFLAGARFDPSRGAPTSFYNRVLANKANSLARHATRMKRDRRNDVSVDEALLLAPDQRHDLRVDVADALDALADEDRAVAGLLATNRVAIVARQTGTTRGKVRSAKARIARALAAKDLAPISLGEQPFPEPTAYVLGNGSIQLQSRRLTGRKAEALAALRPTGGTCPPHPAAEEGAPPCPRP
jgi:DNA-directed RNA polymerase specialized sigma24 family protein